MLAGARTPEELETLLEDAFLLRRAQRQIVRPTPPGERLAGLLGAWYPVPSPRSARLWRRSHRDSDRK